MCRMIGVVSKAPLAIGLYLDELARQAKEGVFAPHADGYGIAALIDGHWLNIREQCPIWEGALDEIRNIRGTLLILHARWASPGTAINLTKLHPFCYPGESPGLLFCQNGTIQKPERIPSRLDSSSIDTEKYFDVVIRHYQESPDMGEAIRRAVEEIEKAQTEPTSLNALFTDGRELVAFKGRVLPQNVGYHTLFVHENPAAAMAVVSTERFNIDGATDWRPLEGVYRKSYS